jgi:hypothetical protein
MFAVLRSDFNSLTSGLIHLTSQPFCRLIVFRSVVAPTAYLVG